MPDTVTSSTRLTRLLAFVELDAGNLTLRKDTIREAFSVGSWDAARKLIDDGLATSPHETELLALSGFAHFQAQRYGEAEEALSKALHQGSDAAEIYYTLAFTRFGRKRHAEALELLTPSVIAALPMTLLLRARCLHHLGRRVEAISECKAHLAAAPDDAECNGLLGLLLYEEELHEDINAHVSVALRQNPKQLEAMLVVASLQSDSGNYDLAAHSFHTLLKEHPECGRAWLGLALVELTQMELPAAKRAIEHATMHLPEHIGSWHVSAWIHIMLGDFFAAKLAFKEALAVDRNFGETHGGLAVIAALQGEEDRAHAGIKRALRLDPQSMSAQFAEMLLLQQHGRHAQAQDVLDTVLARKVAHRDLRYRDLVARQIDYLRARVNPERAGKVALH